MITALAKQAGKLHLGWFAAAFIRRQWLILLRQSLFSLKLNPFGEEEKNPSCHIILFLSHPAWMI